jgi:predicted nucleic acid-binding protein
MIYFFDTSALIKRYHTAQGTDIDDKIFDDFSNSIVICSISLAEIMSALNRIKNRGKITSDGLEIALSTFYSDYHRARIGIIDIKRTHIISCHNLIFPYNLNSSDAIILSCILTLKKI